MDERTRLIQKYCTDDDHAAFRTFYRSEANRLWKFLLARGCDPDTAYDMLAEAFLRFIQTVCKNPVSPVALLYRIALNLRIDAIRRERVAAVDPAVDPDETETPSLGQLDEHADIRRLVKKLPESEQNLLLLRYWIGLSHKELAQTLDRPEGTVRRQCAEALNKLRENWGRDDSDR